jgi:hypothetical protein
LKGLKPHRRLIFIELGGVGNMVRVTYECGCEYEGYSLKDIPMVCNLCDKGITVMTYYSGKFYPKNPQMMFTGVHGPQGQREE